MLFYTIEKKKINKINKLTNYKIYNQKKKKKINIYFYCRKKILFKRGVFSFQLKYIDNQNSKKKSYKNIENNNKKIKKTKPIFIKQ